MQNPVQKFMQNSFVFQKLGILSGIGLKLHLPWSWIFFVKILHTFPAYHCLCKKGVQNFTKNIQLYGSCILSKFSIFEWNTQK